MVIGTAAALVAGFGSYPGCLAGVSAEETASFGVPTGLLQSSQVARVSRSP